MRLTRYILFAIALLAVTPTAAQKRETGFLDRSLTSNGIEYRYQVFVPREFDRRKLWPVILFLHGGGEYGNDGMKQTNGALASAIRREPERFPAIVVFPQAKPDGKPGWQLDGGKAAMAAVDKAIKEFHGDAKRIYLTGMSAGGNGSWYLASQYPERFAAAVIVCGFVFKFKGRATPVEYPAIGPNEADPYGYVASRVSKIPIWIFHGDADDVVPPDESRKMFAALKKIGANVQYTELPKVNHNAWDPTYARKDVIEWMFRQRHP